MINWDDLRFLVALSKTGTMTAAAKSLGTNTATVSRRIERLSGHLGTTAFIKTPDGWQPSGAIKPIIDLAQDFDGALRSLLNEPSIRRGAEDIRVSIGCIPVINSRVLFPGLKKFSKDLDGLSLVFHDRAQREGLGDNDLVITPGAPDHGRVITRKAGVLSFRLYKIKDMPDPQDWIGLVENFDTIDIMRAGFDLYRRPPKVRVENFDAIYQLMNATGYCAPLPTIIGDADERLGPVAAALPEARMDMWMSYHETRRNDPAMRQVVDWILKCFEDLNA